MKSKKAVPVIIFLICVISSFLAVDRFPRPEFESDYKMPETQTPLPRSILFSVIDVVMLTGMLAAATFVIMKRKSRLFLIGIMISSVLYFGFFKKGCICPVGSVQNAALFMFSSEYAITVFTLLFFALPIVFTLFFGRTFCSSVCPFGALQELVLLKPVNIPSYVDGILRLLPFVYLFLTLLFTLSDAGFLICTFDPFVSFFRLSGGLWKIVYSGIFLIIAMFIARPYCRYLCPYGLILSLASGFSRKHLTLSVNECNSCGICGTVCPVNSITPPVKYENKKKNSKIALAVIAPVILIVSGISGYQFGNALSAFHPVVKLSKEISFEEKGFTGEMSVDSKAYRDIENDISKILNESLLVIRNYRLASAGLFLLLAGITMTIIFVSLLDKFRENYAINKYNCVSCMKCTELCPKD